MVNILILQFGSPSKIFWLRPCVYYNLYPCSNLQYFSPIYLVFRRHVAFILLIIIVSNIFISFPVKNHVFQIAI